MNEHNRPPTLPIFPMLAPWFLRLDRNVVAWEIHQTGTGRQSIALLLSQSFDNTHQWLGSLHLLRNLSRSFSSTQTNTSQETATQRHLV